MAATKVYDLRAKRTKANAPRSLFGTIVEIKDTQALHEAKHLEPEIKLKKQDKLTRFMPSDADERLEAVETELQNQEHRVRFQSGKMNDLVHNALCFQPDPDFVQPDIPEGAFTYVPETTYSPYRTDVKHHSRDICLGQQFNKLGFGAKGDFNGHPEYIVKKPGEYNYDRYRPKPDNSKYSHTGNVFGTGGQSFTYKGKDTGGVPQPLSRHSKRSPVFMSQKKSGLDGFKIPANIRVLHGADLCKELMKDEERLKKALHLDQPTKKRTSPAPSTAIKCDVDPMYNSLGNALRSDVFNGVSYGHLKSLNTASYTDDVPKKSTESFPPTFGMLRNADSKWNEDNVIRQRMKKQWDAVIGSKGKDSGMK